MDDQRDVEPDADPDRVFEEMDEDADVEDGDASDSGEAVQRAWEDAEGFEGEAPSG